MRNHFMSKVTDKAKNDDRIMLVIGDLGFSVVEDFRNHFPDRFVNVGIAEQNMSAVAAGLALEGNMVFTYSIGNFPTLRCIEQIRNDICYHNASVKIVAVGAGFAYGSLGMTHHATEDIAMMRVLPNMQVYIPCDSISAEKVADKVCIIDNPCYVRLEKGKEKAIFREEAKIDVSKLQCVVKGKKVAVICVGTIAQEAVEAAHQLKDALSVYVCISLKPFDVNTLKKIAKKYSHIVTVEEHSKFGGLGGVVAEYLAEWNVDCGLIRMGLNDEFTSEVGDQKYLRHIYGLDSEAIVKVVRRCK